MTEQQAVATRKSLALALALTLVLIWGSNYSNNPSMAQGHGASHRGLERPFANRASLWRVAAVHCVGALAAVPLTAW